MTRDDVKKIMLLIFHSYQNAKEPTTADIDAWFFNLEDEDANQVLMATRTYIKTSGSSFPPSVSELIAYARKIDDNTEDYTDAWNRVRPMISRGYYHAEEDFETLPDLIKQCLGTPQKIRNWSQLPSEDIDTTIAAQFRETYKAKQRRAVIEKTFVKIGAKDGEQRRITEQN